MTTFSVSYTRGHQFSQKISTRHLAAEGGVHLSQKTGQKQGNRIHTSLHFTSWPRQRCGLLCVYSHSISYQSKKKIVCIYLLRAVKIKAILWYMGIETSVYSMQLVFMA